MIPDQVAILTATSSGSNNSAYELHGSGLSAFGFYFARALKEDWSCSDSLARDGILTLQEMKEYIGARLELAAEKGAIDAEMSPTMLARDKDALLAYRADKYSEAGFRKLIYSLLIQPKADDTVDLILAGSVATTCADSLNGCTVPISKAYANSDLTVAVTNKRDIAPSGKPPSIPATKTLKLADLLQGSKTVLGVRLTVNQATTGCNSPAIAGVGGDVNIEINSSCSQASPPGSAIVRPQASDSTLSRENQNASGSTAPSFEDSNGPVRDERGSSASTSVQQSTTGSCSPAVADTRGNVTITCAGAGEEAAKKINEILEVASPAPTDWFVIYVVETSNSGYTLNQTRFTYADIQKNSSYLLFRKLLTQIPHPVSDDGDVVIVRLRDEGVLDSAAKTDATSGENLGVLVIPSDVIKQFGSSHLAFTYFKSRINGK